jgi:hypothetical protein
MTDFLKLPKTLSYGTDWLNTSSVPQYQATATNPQVPKFRANAKFGTSLNSSFSSHMPTVNIANDITGINANMSNTLATEKIRREAAENEAKAKSQFSSSITSGLNKLGSNSALLQTMDSLGNVAQGFRNRDGAVGSQNKIKDGINTAVDTVADVASAFGPVGQAIGGAAKLLTKIGTAINYGKKLNDYSVSQELENASGFTGLASDAADAAEMAGKRKVFGRKGANAQIDEMKRLNDKVDTMTNLNKQMQAAVGTVANENEQNNRVARAGGFSNAYMGRSGLKLSKAKSIARNAKKRERQLEEVAMFQEGGKINKRKGQYNIIPGGKLHGRLHNIKDSKPELAEQITRKGIPVVEFGALGEVTQHAEIETGELTLRLKAVEKLEKLIADGSDEALIKAGKFLTNEIINKTIDQTSDEN